MGHPRKSYNYDPLEELRQQVKILLYSEYKSIDEFSLIHDIPKSTISRFLNPPKDLKNRRTEYQIYTLHRLAKILKKRLVIRLEEI
jgi:hypothetical protein